MKVVRQVIPGDPAPNCLTCTLPTFRISVVFLHAIVRSGEEFQDLSSPLRGTTQYSNQPYH